MPRISGAIAFLCSAATIALAQAGPPTPQPPPTFRADTHLVEVSVVVHDKNGAPVTDLTREDFTLLEDGKAQAIEVFSVDGSLSRSSATIDQPERGSTPAAAGEISNRIDANMRASGVTAILFDRVNTRVEDQHLARDQVSTFLRQVRPDDRVALYSLESDRVRVLHDFTNDASALIRALSFRIGNDRPPDDPDLAAWISHTSDAMAKSMLDQRVNVTRDALIAIANHLAGIRGRKNLVWVSSGVPLTFTERLPGGDRSRPRAAEDTSSGALAQAARAIDDANVAIYPIDARGLLTTGVTPAETMPEVAAMKGKITSTSAIPKRGVAQSVSNLDAMQAVAADTGGRAFVNGNDIAGAVRAAIDDSRVNYVLGYYPVHGKWDGTFRAIAVKVNRAGLEVRHRKGYRALPIATKATAAPGDELLQQTKSPLLSTGMGLTAHVAPSGVPGNVELTVHVDPDAISIWRDEAGTGWTVSLALAMAQSTADGRFMKGVIGNVDVGVPAARYEQLMTKGLSFTRTVPLAEQAERLHVVVRDTSSGATGSLIVPLADLNRQ